MHLYDEFHCLQDATIHWEEKKMLVWKSPCAYTSSGAQFGRTGGPIGRWDEVKDPPILQHAQTFLFIWISPFLPLHVVSLCTCWFFLTHHWLFNFIFLLRHCSLSSFLLDINTQNTNIHGTKTAYIIALVRKQCSLIVFFLFLFLYLPLPVGCLRGHEVSVWLGGGISTGYWQARLKRSPSFLCITTAPA